jgi:polyferredoxin
MLNAITTRRIAQSFFFILFIWLCVVTTLGDQWWQLRGWPINWFLQLDPLVGLGVLLATHTLYAGLLWGGVTLMLTLFVGRFFCGWVCPMGTLQQWVGYLGQRGRPRSQMSRRNQPHGAQQIKYWLLLFLLSAAAADLLQTIFSAPAARPIYFWALILSTVAFIAAMAVLKLIRVNRAAIAVVAALLAAGIGLQLLFPQTHWLAASLQTGLLDPIPFMQRVVTLILMPLLDHPLKITSAVPRLYQGVGVMGGIFLLAVLLSLRVPRFYCRFICPLGALMGTLSRRTVWRVVKTEDRCSDCHLCEVHCEGACAPAGVIRTSECVLCLNCLDHCRHDLLSFGTQPSAVGESHAPDLGRRHAVAALVSGLAAVPMLRLSGSTGANWSPDVIRPPGALEEAAFLTRCIKCGQCMRICPTNVIHPAAWQAGLEGLWTPLLNFRMGTSGCQHNCVACSHVCPTAALRPLSVDERMGRNQFASSGALRMGTAFVDRGRCLPWAMDTPCIVCQENCPVSPKAIFTRTSYLPIRNSQVTVQRATGHLLDLGRAVIPFPRIGSGDYFVTPTGLVGEIRWPIVSQTGQVLTLGPGPESAILPVAGEQIDIRVRLQQPYVDPHRCIGCGVCEHECPVQGRRAIRVTAENESRSTAHRLIIS